MVGSRVGDWVGHGVPMEFPSSTKKYLGWWWRGLGWGGAGGGRRGVVVAWVGMGWGGGGRWGVSSVAGLVARVELVMAAGPPWWSWSVAAVGRG